MLLLKNFYDVGLHINKEFIDVPKSLADMVYTSEAQYVDKKIRMHVKILPSATDETAFKDALEEFMYLLGRISSDLYNKDKFTAQLEFELCMATYEELQLAITKISQ